MISRYQSAFFHEIDLARKEAARIMFTEIFHRLHLPAK